MPEVEATHLTGIRAGLKKLHGQLTEVGHTMQKGYREPTFFERSGDVETIVQGIEACQILAADLKKSYEADAAEVEKLRKERDGYQALAERFERLAKGEKACKPCASEGQVDGKPCTSCAGTGFAA